MLKINTPEELIELIKVDPAREQIMKDFGIDEYDAEDVLLALENGETEALNKILTPYVIAEAKLKREASKYNLEKSILSDWFEYIKKLALENEGIARMVIFPEKSFEGCMAALMEYSFTNAFEVPAEIVKKALPNVKGKVTLGIPNSLECRRIITRYYAED